MELKYLNKFDYFKDKDLSNRIDFLTNVLNRQTAFDYVNYLIEHNIPFTVCVSDIDNFKNINDTYGHLVGDRILKGVAYLFENCIKDKGVVGRFGGDEFIFIFENITEYDDVWIGLHGYIKQSNTIPKNEIKRAIGEIKLWKLMHTNYQNVT